MLKKGIILVVTIVTTYGSRSKSNVFQVDISNVNWKINPIEINHKTLNAKTSGCFSALKSCGLILIVQ